jgi:hypothetical protein
LSPHCTLIFSHFYFSIEKRKFSDENVLAKKQATSFPPSSRSHSHSSLFLSHFSHRTEEEKETETTFWIKTTCVLGCCIVEEDGSNIQQGWNLLVQPKSQQSA